MKKAASQKQDDQAQTDYNTTREIETVLSFIPANLPREEWAQVAMALKSAGISFEVFDHWSATAGNYDPKSARDTWKSVNADGGITIKTLFHTAKKYGYDLRQSKHDFKPLIEQAKHRQSKSDKARSEAAKKAAERAEAILDSCDYAPSDHPYLVAKRIRPVLPVWLYRGAITIPVMDLFGNIHSLQFIQPDGKKVFLKNGAISGHFYQLLSRKSEDEPIVICEGFATGCTLAEHYTVNCSIVVAFNSANLKPVAEAFKKAFPDSRILIAGDADEAGRKAAFKAAEAIGGDVALPVFMEDEDGTDWNDRWALDGVQYE